MMMTFKQIRDINYRVRLYKTDKENINKLIGLGLSKYAATILASLHGRKLTQLGFMQIFDSKKSKSKKVSKNKIQKQKHQFKVAKGLSELREVRLFTWNEDDELISYLFNHYDIDWVKAGVIERFVGGKTIRVVNGKNYLTLSLGDNWRIINQPFPNINSWKWKQHEHSTKVKLIIDDGRTDEFVGKMIGRPAKLIVFKNRGWLNEREDGQFPEDAKYKKYSLKVPFENIIAELEKQVKEKSIKNQAKIERLKEFASKHDSSEKIP